MHVPVRSSFFRIVAAALMCLGAGASPAQDEVPFITSPDNVTLEMLRIANVRAGDHVIDLGSGDGRIVILAAKRFGATGLGVELVPELVQQSIRDAEKAGVGERVTFREQDLFRTDLSKATVITMYLLPEVNLQLRPSLLSLKPGTRVVSHDWDMGDWKPDQTSVVPVPDKQVGLEKFSKVHLWVVPANVQGLWCGAGRLRGASLKLTQRYQAFEGSLQRRPGAGERELKGRIQGALLRASDGRAGKGAFQASGDELRVASANGALGLAKGEVFMRSTTGSCAA